MKQLEEAWFWRFADGPKRFVTRGFDAERRRDEWYLSVGPRDRAVSCAAAIADHATTVHLRRGVPVLLSSVATVEAMVAFVRRSTAEEDGLSMACRVEPMPSIVEAWSRFCETHFSGHIMVLHNEEETVEIEP